MKGLRGKHKKTYDNDKLEVERLHNKKELNFSEVDFMLKYYRGRL